MEETERRGLLFWTSAAVGAALVAWGLRGALHHHFDTRPASLARFFFGGAVVHDLIVAPIVLLAGWGVARVVSGPWRAPLQAFLIAAGVVLLIGYPEVRDYAHILHNPTSLPRNYTLTVGIVIASAGAVILGAFVRSRVVAHRPPPGPPPGPPSGPTPKTTQPPAN